MKSYNFDPRGSVFVNYNGNIRFINECIDVMVIDCDGDMDKYTLTIEQAREVALHLLQEVDKAVAAEAIRNQKA